MNRGKFITFEGGEGAGKTSNIELIRSELAKHQINVVITREPGGTKLSERIRDILLDKSEQNMHADTELLLMFAARAQHIRELIIPALQQGKWVICDRFTDATYAYQGGGRGIDESRIEVLEAWVQQDLRPDKTLLFDLPVQTGMDRAGQRSEPDRFEIENLTFFNNVREQYLKRAKQEPQRFAVIDASMELDQVQAQVRTVISEIISEVST